MTPRILVVIVNFRTPELTLDCLRSLEPEVRRVVRLIRVNEYKRRQAPVGIRITHRGFGRDWRYPITNRFREDALK